MRGQRPRPLDYGTIEKRILAELMNNFQKNNIKAGNRHEARRDRRWETEEGRDVKGKRRKVKGERMFHARFA